MSLVPTWDKISSANNSTTAEFGGNWGNLISDYFNGVNIGLTEPNKVPIPGTLTRFKHEKLGLFDNDQSHYIVFSADDMDTGGIRKVKFRRMNTGFEEDYAVLETLPQSFLNKIIDFSNNTASNVPGSAIVNNSIADSKLITITDKTKQHAQTVYLDSSSQIFTQSINIALASATPLTIRNATNTVGATVGTQLHMRDSGNNNTVYSKAESRIVTNTDTAEDGTYDIYTIKGGILRQIAIFDDELFTFGRIGERIILDTTGINTTSKTITWGNFGGTPVIEDATQLMSNKTITSSTLNASSNTITNIGDSAIAAHTSTKITITNKAHLPSDTIYDNDGLAITNKIIDFRKVSTQRRSRYGRITPDSPGGEGVLRNTNVMGDDGGNNSNTAGKYKILNTTATAADWCGYAKLDNFTCTRSVNPLIRFAHLYVTGGNRRVFKGLIGAKRIVTTTSNSAPLGASEAGFLIGYAIGDTDWQIFHNDTSGSCVKETTGIALSGSNTNYIIEIQGNNSGTPSFAVSFYAVNSDGSKGSQVGSTTTITTDIPSSTDLLYLEDILVTTDATIRPLNTHYTEVEI